MNEFFLIELVNSRPEVWDSNSVQFRNKHIKTGAWKNIAQQLQTTVEECQVTWKKLRDRYTRTKRMLPSGSEGGRRQWDKEKLLGFLDKILVTRRTTSNATEPQDSDNIILNEENDVIEDSQAFLWEQDEITAESHDVSQIHNFDPIPTTTTAEIVVAIPTSDQDQQEEIALDLLSPRSSNSNSSNAKKRKQNNKTPYAKEAITESLINAINKVTQSSEDSQAVAPADDINETFLRFHCQQIRELLSNKGKLDQRNIRNRLSAFIDSLYDELAVE